MKEEWRDIPEYEGFYQASNYGRIKSLSRYVVSGKSRRFIEGRIRKQRKDLKGYLSLSLHKNKKEKSFKVHRIVLTVFDRPPKEGEEGNHKDGNKSNNYLENIEWVTHKQNCEHRDNILGKHQRGENNNQAELTEEQIKGIGILLKEGKLLQKEIAEKFNVSGMNIGRIKTGKLWSHVKD
jgi:hypothetical protein